MSCIRHVAIEAPLVAWQSVGFAAGNWRLGTTIVSLRQAEGKSRITVGVSQLFGDVGVENIEIGSHDFECLTISNDLGLSAIDHLLVRTLDAGETLRSLSIGLDAPISSDDHGERSVWLDSIRIDMVPTPDLTVRAELWGIAFLVDDLDTVTDRLGSEVIGEPRPARQAGQRVAVFRSAAGLDVPTALMDHRG